MDKWTILIYANGNNELEPEVYQRFIELLNKDIKKTFNIIVQIGRANMDIVKTLRPNAAIEKSQRWHGVRRYKIQNYQATLLDDLGNINMADPSCFVDFVTWGMKKYRTSRTMVIISGHGAGFVGIMTDYTNDRPYMMDILGLTSSLYKIKVNTGQNIDCLVLDACYMNMVEVWNEIANIPNKPVKYLFAPSKNIELEGLSYSEIIKNIKLRITLHKSLLETIKSINTNYNNDLLLVKLSKRNFNKLKKEINYISEFLSQKNIRLRSILNKWCLFKPLDPLISILDLKEILNAKYPKKNSRKKHIEEILSKIIVYPIISSIHIRLNHGPSLYLPFNLRQYLELRYYYDSLSFSQHNSWLKVVGGQGNILSDNYYHKQFGELQSPMVIPINYVAASILDQNPDISVEEVEKILKDIGWYKDNSF